MAGSVDVSVDTDTQAYMRTLAFLERDALPEAAAETLNRTADAVTNQQIRNVRRDLIVRTPFTLRSMTSPRSRPYRALNKARGKNIDRMFSRAGTYSPYLWLQEDDRTVRGIDGPVPIPTLDARVGKSNRRPIRKTFRLQASDTLDGSLGPKTFAGAPRGGGRRRGVYLRSNRNKRLTMIRNLEHQSVRIRGSKFHSKAVRRYGTQQYVAAQHRRAVLRRVQRRPR